VSERRDYYEVLGVARDADAGELKRAYRKLAMELHPDRNPGDQEAEENFKSASEAYQVLSDPEKRAYYDRFGHAGPGAGMGGFHDVHDLFSSFGDILGDLFGGAMGGGGRRGAPSRGAHIETRMVITLAEAFTGVTKAPKGLRRTACATSKGAGAAPGTSPETCQRCGGRGQVMHSQGFLMISSACPTCRGEGRVIRKPCRTCDGSGLDHEEETLEVAIPPGVEDGSTLRLMGRGEAAPQGGRAGNLYVILRVQPDERFERDGADLHTEIAVSFPQLALGDRVTVATVAGEEVLEIPAGSQANQTISLSGSGMPRVDRGGKGDLVVHLRLVVPTSLSAAEEAHLRAFADAGGSRVNPERDSAARGKKKK
jgi:molecular chaperone DnaJ